jgi:hypothetical protein
MAHDHGHAHGHGAGAKPLAITLALVSVVAVRSMLRQRFGIQHSTVQLEARPCEQEGAGGSLH